MSLHKHKICLNQECINNVLPCFNHSMAPVMITERKHDKWNVTKNMTSKNCRGGFEGKERANGKYILTKHQCIKCPTQHAWIREQYNVNTMQFGQVDGCRRHTNEMKEQNMLQIKHMHKTWRKKMYEITATSFTFTNKYVTTFLYHTDPLIYKLFLSSTFSFVHYSTITSTVLA